MVEYAEIRRWADRVRLVRDYREGPGKWPDGIDTKYNRWYLGNKDYWLERAGRLVAGGWEGGVDDEVAYGKWSDGGFEGEAEAEVEVEVEKRAGGRPKVIDGEPWVAAGVSKATWYRRRAAEGGG